MSATNAKNPLCLTTLLRICGGNKEFANVLLGKFKRAAPDRVQGIREGIRARDSEKVRQMAHALKGSAAALGILDLSDLASKIELAAKDNDLQTVNDRVEDLVRLVDECEKAEFT